jgi:hypothetical protein
MGWNLLILLSVINLIAIIDKTERVFVQLPRKPDFYYCFSQLFQLFLLIYAQLYCIE